MASFYAELHVAGHSYPVWSCTYEFRQATSERGRVLAKVRHGLVQLTLDVPHDEVLLAWAATPHKPLAGSVVFRDAKGDSVLETLSWEGGECVGYQEEFRSGEEKQGAYVCHLTIVAPKLTLQPGAPTAYVAPPWRAWPPPAGLRKPAPADSAPGSTGRDATSRSRGGGGSRGAGSDSVDVGLNFGQ